MFTLPPRLFLIAISLILSPVLGFATQVPDADKSIQCASLLNSAGEHRPKVEIKSLNETDIHLWAASENGNQEVGIVELVAADGKILAATDLVYQAHSGNIIQTNIHVPIKDAFFDFVQSLTEIPKASAVRFTHVHPKIVTSSGVLFIGPNWLFSPGDKQGGYVMKFVLEQAGLSHLSLEMHLVYQPPFATQPKKKMYRIESHYTWSKGSYSMGAENDRRLRAAGQQSPLLGVQSVKRSSSL